METTATLNPIMTGIANQFMRDYSGFVGRDLFPAFPSALQSAAYYLFDAEELANVPKLEKRAPGTKYPRITSKVSNDTYFCSDYGIEAPVPDEDRAKYKNFFDADKAKIRRIVDTILVNHEQRVHDLSTDKTQVPNADVQVKWNDGASNPKNDVDAAKEQIRLNIGLTANVMVMSNPTFLALQAHPRLLDVFKYTQAGLLNEQKLAQYFGVDRLLIAKSVIATNNEGQAFNPADIWGADVILAHVQTEADLERPNFGRTFFWTAFTSQINAETGGTGPGMATGGGASDLLQIFSYRDETVKSDIHRSEHYVGEKLVGSKAGYMLNSVLA